MTTPMKAMQANSINLKGSCDGTFFFLRILNMVTGQELLSFNRVDDYVSPLCAAVVSAPAAYASAQAARVASAPCLVA